MAVVDMLCAAASVLLLPLVQTVELKVSMHCYGCAKKVQKHISKMAGMRELILQSIHFWGCVIRNPSIFCRSLGGKKAACLSKCK